MRSISINTNWVIPILLVNIVHIVYLVRNIFIEYHSFIFLYLFIIYLSVCKIFVYLGIFFQNPEQAFSECSIQQESDTKERYLFLVLQHLRSVMLYGVTNVCLRSEEERNILYYKCCHLRVEQEQFKKVNRSGSHQIDQESLSCKCHIYQYKSRVSGHTNNLSGICRTLLIGSV